MILLMRIAQSDAGAATIAITERREVSAPQTAGRWGLYDRIGELLLCPPAHVCKRCMLMSCIRPPNLMPVLVVPTVL